MTPPAHWAQRPERSNTATLRLMRWIAQHLGRRAARLLLLPISLYFLLACGNARRASRHYLQRVTGRASWALSLAHFRHFAATVLDRVYLLLGRFELFDIEIEGAEALQAILARGHGALLMGAHVGSFEVLRAAGRCHAGHRVLMLMYPDNARKINAALQAINPAATQDIIALGQLDSMLQVRDSLASGALVGILADRTPGGEHTQALPFLGAPAHFPLGPWRMAALLGAPVVFMSGTYLGDRRYRIAFTPLADFTGLARGERAAAIVAAQTAYVAQLEQICRNAPLNWFNFFDFWQDSPAS